MKVWDLIESEAFKKASNSTPIWYADGSIGYIRLSFFAQVVDMNGIVFFRDGKKVLTKKMLLEEMLVLDFDLYVSPSESISLALNTQGCAVALEDCGIVIKERDLL